MSTKTKIGMWMFTLLAVAFAGIDARGGFIHLDTPEWGSPHAEFHMVTGLFYTLALCAIVVILTWIPLKRGDSWAWWTIALAAITIHGGHFLGDTMTDGGLSQSQAAQGAGIMFLRLSGLALLLYFVALGLTRSHVKRSQKGVAVEPAGSHP